MDRSAGFSRNYHNFFLLGFIALTAITVSCMAWSFTEHSLLIVYKEEFDYDEDDVVNRRYSYVALDDCPLEKPYPCEDESVSRKGIGKNNDYNSDHNYSSDITLVNQHW